MVQRWSRGAQSARPSTTRRLAPWLVTVALAASLAVALWPHSAPPDPLYAFEVTAPPRAELAEFSVAPDGSALVFVTIDRGGTSNLWLRPLDSTEPRLLPNTEGAQFPFWSPDARSVAFFAGGRLLHMDLASLSVQTVASAPNGRGGAWSADGTILFTPQGEDVLYAVPAAGGTPVAVTHLGADEASHRFPHFVSDGKRFTFCGHGASRVTTHRYLGTLGSDELVALPDGMSETYVPPGRALFVREGTLVAQTFDAGSGRLTGNPVPLATGVYDIFPRTGRSSFSVSDNGVLAFLQELATESRFAWYDRNGRELETISPVGEYRVPAIANDFTKVAFERTEPGAGARSIWVMDVVRGAVQRLSASGLTEASVIWDNAGRSLFYGVGNEILLRQDLAGGALDTVLVSDRLRGAEKLQAVRDMQVYPDDSFLLFTAWDSATDYDLWRLPLNGDRAPQRLQRTPRVQARARISPDMRWIAYESDESGRYEVYIRPAAPSERQWLVSTAGGSRACWSADGSELYYLSRDDYLMAVPMANGRADDPGAGLPVPLFRAPAGNLASATGASKTPELLAVDKGRFLFNVAHDDGREPTIKVVINWERMLTTPR